MEQVEGRALRSALRAEPNVTPMIDVLLVLLIVFMLVAPPQQRRIDAQLPDLETTDGGAATGIVLEVAPGGRMALNRQPVTEAALGARLRAIYAGRPEKAIVVRGARTARYQAVIAAMDSARGPARARDRPRPTPDHAIARLRPVG